MDITSILFTLFLVIIIGNAVGARPFGAIFDVVLELLKHLFHIIVGWPLCFCHWLAAPLKDKGKSKNPVEIGKRIVVFVILGILVVQYLVPFANWLKGATSVLIIIAGVLMLSASYSSTKKHK